MPLRVSCPGPVLRLFSSGGGGLARSLCSPAWLWVLAPLWVGLCVRGGPASGGAWGGEGRLGRGGLRAASPWGVVGPGLVGRPQGWGLGSRSSVPLPPLPWRVRCPYCYGPGER